MQQTGNRTLPATREAVWVALGEPDVLRRCLPGCRSVERVSDVEFNIEARLPHEPEPFEGPLRLREVDPPAGLRFTVELRSGNERVVAAAGRVDLTAAGDATVLRYELALSGSALPRSEGDGWVDPAASLADAFFLRLEQALAERPPSAPPPPAPAPSRAKSLADDGRRGLRPLVWVPALMLVVALILYGSS